MKKIDVTLAMVVNGDKILLGHKKKSFGKGFFNGFGGKLEAGESIEQAMVRELREESGLEALRYEKAAFLEFDVVFKGERALLVCHVYLVTEFNGEPIETDEMRPEWFDLGSIPYDKMFPDDKYWLPLVLDGKKVDGFFHFDEDLNVLDYKIEVVKEVI